MQSPAGYEQAVWLQLQQTGPLQHEIRPWHANTSWPYRPSPCCRLALIPMAQEARGLDAGMRLVQRLLGVGDKRSSAIVMRIAQEERAHGVAPSLTASDHQLCPLRSLPRAWHCDGDCPMYGAWMVLHIVCHFLMQVLSL